MDYPTISFLWMQWKWQTFSPYLAYAIFKMIPWLTLFFFIGVFTYKAIYHYNFDYDKPKTFIENKKAAVMHSMIILCDLLKIIYLWKMWKSPNLIGSMYWLSLITFLCGLCSVVINDYIGESKFALDVKYETSMKTSITLDLVTLLILPFGLNKLFLLMVIVIFGLRTFHLYEKNKDEKIEIKNLNNKEISELVMLVLTFIIGFTMMTLIVALKAVNLWYLSNIHILSAMESFCINYKTIKNFESIMSASKRMNKDKDKKSEKSDNNQKKIDNEQFKKDIAGIIAGYILKHGNPVYGIIGKSHAISAAWQIASQLVLVKDISADGQQFLKNLRKAASHKRNYAQTYTTWL